MKTSLRLAMVIAALGVQADLVHAAPPSATTTPATTVTQAPNASNPGSINPNGGRQGNPSNFAMPGDTVQVPGGSGSPGTSPDGNNAAQTPNGNNNAQIPNGGNAAQNPDGNDNGKSPAGNNNAKSPPSVNPAVTPVDK